MTQVSLAKTRGALGSYTSTDRMSTSYLRKSDSASFASLRKRKPTQTATKPHAPGKTLFATHARSHYGRLFLLICIGYLCTLSDKYFGQISDGQIMFETAVSLREFGELGIRPERDPVSGQIAEYDRIRKYGVGFSIVQQAPLLFVPLVEKILGDGRSNALLPFTNLLLTAMTALLVALCMREMGFRFRTGALAAAGFAFSTFAWPYISYDFSEPLQALCLVAAFWLLLLAIRNAPHSCISLALAGFALGFAVLTKAFLLVLIPSYALYLWASLSPKSYRLMAWFVLPLAVVLVCVSAVNIYRFGSVLEFGYGSEGLQFTTPLWTGLYGLLFSPNKGLIFYAPLTLLVPWSLWRNWSSFRREALFFVSIFAIIIPLTSKWWSWEGGWSWGPRLLLPIVPLATVCAAMILESARRSLVPFVACMLAGVAINLLGVMVYFSAWLNVVGLHSGRLPLDIEGRPNSEYEAHDDRRWFYPAIGTYYLPSLSPILGHAWLLRLRYLDVPFSLRVLSDPSSGSLPSVKYPPLQFNFEPLQDFRGRFVIWQLRSANLWLWDTLLQRPREETLSYPIYGLMLERLGDRADKQGNARRALSCYRRAVELMPVYINASLKLSQIYFKLGARAEAEQALLQFLGRRPQEGAVRFHLARFYELTGERRRALDQYRTYLAFHPDDKNRAMIEQRIAQLSAAPPQ